MVTPTNLASGTDMASYLQWLQQVTDANNQQQANLQAPLDFNNSQMAAQAQTDNNDAGSAVHVAVTPGESQAPNQMNVVEYSGNVVGNPSDFFTTDNPETPTINESMFLSQRNTGPNMDDPGSFVDPNNPAQQAIADATAVNAANTQAAEANPTAANTYQAADAVADTQAHQTQAAQGQLSQGSQVDVNAGQAGVVQGQAAQQDLNTVDPRATVRGQLEQMQSDWVDPATGEPKIPIYAQAQAREVSKIASFTGMTGTAATAAMSTAMQEASITMAEKDAAFFQTLTLENLSNRQETAINNANILANIELTNADNRLAAAIQNAQQFLDMDLANLDNQQQANVLDSQARIQAILDKSNQENVARKFNAESQNETDQFFEQLNSQIRQFNASLTQDNNQFNSSLMDSRQKYYSEMQFQIDQYNANWRREVTLNEDIQNFEAAKEDVTNMVGISNEALNRIWDTTDALLDYAWKTSDNESQRDHELVIAKLQTQAAAQLAREERQAANEGAIGGLFGGLLGDAVSSFVGGIFG